MLEHDAPCLGRCEIWIHCVYFLLDIGLQFCKCSTLQVVPEKKIRWGLIWRAWHPKSCEDSPVIEENLNLSHASAWHMERGTILLEVTHGYVYGKLPRFCRPAGQRRGHHGSLPAGYSAKSPSLYTRHSAVHLVEDVPGIAAQSFLLGTEVGLSCDASYIRC